MPKKLEIKPKHRLAADPASIAVRLKVGTAVDSCLASATPAAAFLAGLNARNAATAINDIAPVSRRSEAVSYFSVSVHLSLALGPALGELTLGDSRFRMVFLLASILALTAGDNALRFAPALVLGEADIDQACGILDKALV